MTRRLGLVFGSLCSLCMASPARADTLRVGVDAPTVQAAVSMARDGDVVEVPEGTWAGPVVVDRAITLRGVGGVLDGGGEGSVLTVSGPGARVEGLEIVHGGEDLSGPDACIYMTKAATGAVLSDNELSGCAFGIWIHETVGASILANHVRGSELGHRSNRGNGIQLFNAEQLRVADNVITGGRDGIYVSATEDSLIADNVIERARYGIHYMFSYSNEVRDNHVSDSGSGVAIMSSHHLDVHGNTARGNLEHGILFRDVQYSEIYDNTLLDNGEGLFFYSSTENTIYDNRVIHNEVGAKIWAGSIRNEVRGNAFIGNRRQVLYVSTKDLVWADAAAGNFWSDYLGWDQDGDGLGDRPYRVDSFSTSLVYRYPSAVLLLRSPALELLGHLEQRMPLLRVPTVIDLQPMLRTERP